MMAAVLALTMAACGKGGNDKKEPDGGTQAAASSDCVYSAQPIELQDNEGFLADFNMENLICKDGRIYAAGYSYGFSDSGTHALVNFAPDGSDLQYSLLIGGGMQDILAMNIGSDGNYYVAKVSYDSDSAGFTTADGEQSGPGGAEGPAGAVEEGPRSAEGPAGAVEEGPGSAEGPGGAVEEGPGGAEGPAGAVEEGPGSAEGGPGAQGSGQVVEFYTEGGDSPANDPALQEESTNGITSPADELKGQENEADAEEELIVSEAVEVDPASAAQTGESVYVLSCIAPDGRDIWTVPARVPENGEMDYFVNSVAYSKDGLIVSTSMGLDLYSAEDGSYIRTISTDDQLKSITPYVLEDGTVVTVTYGGTGEQITVIDMETGKAGDSYPVPSEAGMSFVFPGKTWQLYMAGANAIYGMNLDGNGIVKVVDYVDSDMDVTAVTGLAEMEDGKLAAVVSDLTGTSIVEILSKVDPEVVANRKTITLGSYYLDYEVRKQVFAFNKTNQDVRISIVDYSQFDGETGTEGLTKLNTDIASGSAPDVLVLSPIMPISSYISKGVFEDLTSYMESDEEISGKEYLTNVFDAFRNDGKTYAVIPSFYVNTVIGKTEDIGDGSGFTLDFADQLAASKGIDPGRMFGLASREDILYQAMELCGDQFIDWERSECKFDSPEFIRLLEFISQFPGKLDDAAMQEDTTAFYRNGKALFARESLGTFDEYVNLRYGYFGTEIAMAGFPSQTPGTAAIAPQLEIAVNAASDQKDACWSFVRRFLLDDYQNSIEMYWPVSISALDQLANKAMEPIYYTDENGQKVEDHIIMNIGGENVELPRISDSEVDQIYAFLRGLSSKAYFDRSVENIIVEEAAAFFEGQKSAKDVAGVIQSRVQIYINENS